MTTGGFSVSEAPISGTRLRELALELDCRGAIRATRPSRAASRRPRHAAPPGRDAARSAAGPPWSTVSAALTTTTRSVSTSAGLTRSGTRPPVAELDEVRIGRRRAPRRLPENRRASSWGTRLSSSRWPACRPSPPATRSVCRSSGTPTRSSSATAAAKRVLPRIADGARDRERRRLDDDRRPAPRGSRAARADGPASGNRSASRTAAPTSASGSAGGGGRSTMRRRAARRRPVSREPARSGTRTTG